MSNNLWTYFTALFSVAFGWILNELGQYLKTRREDKRIKKKVLYFLFETLYAFRKLDISEEIELITEKAYSMLPNEAKTEEGRQFLKNLYQKLLPKLVEKDARESLLDLEESYKKAIDDLALVDPISAYRLKGKNRILQTFDLLTNYFNDAKKQFPEDIEDLENRNEISFDLIKPEILNTAIKDLEDEIKQISLSISIWTRIEAKKILRKFKINKIDKKRENELDEFINKFISSYSENNKSKV